MGFERLPQRGRRGRFRHFRQRLHQPLLGIVQIFNLFQKQIFHTFNFHDDLPLILKCWTRSPIHKDDALTSPISKETVRSGAGASACQLYSYGGILPTEAAGGKVIRPHRTARYRVIPNKWPSQTEPRP
jgi:hypothetical protein